MSTSPRFRGVICDLDGTVYLSGRPLPGAVAALAAIRAAGVRVVFVSNNPHRDAAAYAERLTGIGIPAEPADVLTSGGILADWLRTHLPGGRALVLGEDNLFAELSAAGMTIVDKADRVDVVVASFDRTFTYAKWREAFDALRAGARFVATNPDPTCPVDGGEVPDCGGIIAALETTTGRRVEQVAGKPSPLVVDAALDRLGLTAEEVLVVGDRLATDIELGARSGLASVLVLSGVTTPAMLDEGAWSQPTYVVDSIADLPATLGIGVAASSRT